jgi:NADPH:quinone reductase-like Zn-dependent oxidoreductase
MRAVVGRKGELRVEEVAEPVPGPGQLLIRVAAATVNPVDVATLDGVLTRAGLVPERDVLGLGWDVAGVVAATGPGTTRFSTGDRVIGLSDRLDVELGTHADLVVLDEVAVARAPSGMSDVEAATLPLNGLTATQALDALGLSAGETLLVTGAAGAVGGFAVELAVARGLRVVAVAGTRDEALVRELGASWFVPRDAPRLGAAVREVVPGGVDGAIDAAVVGAAALDGVRSGGAFVSLVAGGAPTPLRGTRVHQVWISSDGPALDGLARLAESGRLTPRVAETMPLDRAAQAYARLGSGLRGRVVLVP